MKTKTYDFRSFVQRGELIRTDNIKSIHHPAVVGTALAGTFASIDLDVHSHPVPAIPQEAIAVFASATSATAHAVSFAHAFDPVISMLQTMAFPVATIVLAWACLQAMIGKPAAAIDRAKWAILGYLAMRYAPEILRGLQ